MTPHEIADELEGLQKALSILGGCSDGNCCIVRPVGMHTNAGCKCVYKTRDDDAQRRKIEKVLRSYQIGLRNLPAIIAALRQPRAVSPALVEKLKALASRLTQQGDYEAVDLIDTVVDRVSGAMHE